MIAYLDSSVLLRALLNQPGKLEEFSVLKRPIASILMKTECLRALDRLRVLGKMKEGDHLLAIQQLYEALDSVEFIHVDPRVLERAASSFAFPLGTLDALHLASAILWRESFKLDLIFLTHDEELGKAAKAQGFRVLGC